VGHPRIDNGTPFAFEPVFIADEDLRPAVVTVVKATYQFDLEGTVSLADQQVPVNLTGEPWTDNPISSYRYEPEVALCKLATDVVLIGHAHPTGGNSASVDVGIKVGPVQKVARVFGDRFWVQSDGVVRITRANPVEPLPLTWENAFGGVDVVNSTPERQILESRNPVGTGFGRPLMRNGDRLKLPNIEDPNDLIRDYGSSVAPCGFGFTSPNWQPRVTFAGTYEDEWTRTRKPMLPADFDRRFFNAAPPGLVVPGHLRGGEDVVLLNTTAVSRVAFRLPAIAPPTCRVVVRRQQDVQLETQLDTVIVNADELQLLLIWRAYATLVSGPHDVTAIVVGSGS
jgi:hypothetical protein